LAPAAVAAVEDAAVLWQALCARYAASSIETNQWQLPICSLATGQACRQLCAVLRRVE